MHRRLGVNRAQKKENPDADVSALESEIDQLVYRLYGLTDEEVKIVEGRG
jgi:adenine-specific DNA-methyltransferase